MKKILLLALAIFSGSLVFGQILNPVKWSFSSKQVSDKEFDLVFTATIDDNWTVYSQFLEGDDGPVPTSFEFTAGSHFTKIGKTEESPENRKTVHDDVFDMQVTKFYHKATFTQRVRVSDFSKPVAGYLTYMTCDNSRCLPPTDVDFKFELKPSGSPATGKAAEKEQSKPADQPDKSGGNTSLTPTPIVPLAAPGDVKNGLLDPVHWSLTVEKLSEQEFNLVFKAAVDKGWYLYSQNIQPGGPEPTVFTFDQNPNVEAVGKASETSAHKVEGQDPVFKMKVTKYKEEVTFTQKIKVKDASQEVTGFLTFMACDDRKCTPPTDVPFKATPATLAASIGEAADETAAAGIGEAVDFMGLCGFNLDKSKAQNCGVAPEEEKKSMGVIFLLGFFGGLLALLTPCVFPMIPLTVSFFTKSSGNRRKGLTNASLYGFFILLVYLLCSLPFHLLDSISPDILNDISTNVFLNIFFFLIFLVFAFSFFGYYELTLPSSWANKVSAAEGIGGTIGIFFMALTLVLVSFSCTGPILGALLGTVLDSNAGPMQLTAGMAGFGVALGLPFGLFAAFPSWMSNLPKSGGWMTTVKVVLGFIELALALKFLSNADLVKHWGLLKIEPFLVLWILIALAMGVYLLGKIRFPHDSPLKKLSPARLGLAVASFGFAAYLATGFFFDEKAGSLRPLKLLSGLAPPACYSWVYPCDCPQNISCFKDFCEGLAYAKEMNKPILIDFTGHACVNCRKMEEHVWPEREVYKYLKDDYVLISLYVDEKIDLPADQQKEVPMKSGGTRKLRTTGNKWAHFQTENFNNNSQPYYVLLSPDGKLLNTPVPYTPDPAEYANFLQCGLDAFKNLQAEQGQLGEK